MPEEIKDVTSAPSPETAQEVVNQEPVVSTPTETAQPSQEQSQAPLPTIEAVDEQGVPWRNRALEWQRKAADYAEKIPSLVETKMQEVLSKQQQQTTQPKYSVSELEAFAQTNPTYRPWVEEQKQALLAEQVNKTLDEKLALRQKETEAHQIRQQSEQFVMNKFPNLFVKDMSGQTTWNHRDPMTGIVAQYLQDPGLQGHPRALEIASRLAYADIALSTKGQAVKQQEQLKAQVKSIEKRTMVEGGGKQVPIETSSPIRSAIDKARSGRMDDARDAVSAVFKNLGYIKE